MELLLLNDSLPNKYLLVHLKKGLLKYNLDWVNAIEGIAQDLSRGHVPNIFAERGWKAEWKHNPRGLAQKVIITVAIAAAVYALVNRKKLSRR